jgi:hypothetical protein
MGSDNRGGKGEGKGGGGKPPKRTVPVPGGSGGGFVTCYVHYRTGKLMDARAYGYKAWPFGCGGRA